MNQINPKKLLNSKWTAVTPVNKERHFLVTKVVFDENNDNEVADCVVEAIMSKRLESIEWEQLKDTDQWLQGWK